MKKENQNVNASIVDANVVKDEDAVVYGKSSEMPEPKTMEYTQLYQISERFVHDLRICVADMPYNISYQYITFAENKSAGISVAELNEYIQKLSTLPFKYVEQLMRNCNSEEGQKIYFPLVKND
jgi:hypothetical protein